MGQFSYVEDVHIRCGRVLACRCATLPKSASQVLCRDVDGTSDPSARLGIGHDARFPITGPKLPMGQFSYVEGVHVRCGRVLACRRATLPKSASQVL